MHGTLGARMGVDLTNKTLWRTTVSTLSYGLCHTLLYPGLVEADMLEDAVYLSLDTELRYWKVYLSSLSLALYTDIKMMFQEKLIFNFLKTPETVDVCNWEDHRYVYCLKGAVKKLRYYTSRGGAD